jgi:hypothetical protein
MNAVRRGLYRHHKGNLYLVTSVVSHVNTKEKLVVCKGEKGASLAMPLKMFLSTVKYKGSLVDRFKFESEFNPILPF